MATSAVDVNSTGAVSSDKSTYRQYVKLGTVTEGDTTKTVISEKRIMQETAAKATSGLSQNWQKAEDDGLVVFNENEVVSYAVNSQEGFELLIPDSEQRLYIINAGLGNLQTSKAQAFMKAMAEYTTEPTPQFNQQTLDLRVGVGEDNEYSIQVAPQRRSLTDQQKLEKTLKGLNLSPEALQQLLLSVASSIG